MERHKIMPGNALLFHDWVTNRGGVAIWGSVNLSDPGRTVSTPYLEKDGTPKTKPDWQCANNPMVVITDASKIDVIQGKEVKRFRVAVRMGSQGFSLKLTDHSTKKVNDALEKAGENSWYEFDYFSQEAIIYAPASVVPLNEWVVNQ